MLLTLIAAVYLAVSLPLLALLWLLLAWPMRAPGRYDLPAAPAGVADAKAAS